MTNLSDSLLESVTFSPRSLEAPDAFVGHLPFVAWLMHMLAPSSFVELGTHSGNSYFAFCQSVQENGLATKCYAVDTWQGDEHAGCYTDEVFTRVRAHNQEHYADFSHLLRMTFDDALSNFSDASIELLHIDGLHTYEAVKHDFESWLPKLAPGAVILFHDTSVSERGFGVWRLWQELQTLYPNNLEFLHSNGLGVLQLNDESASKTLAWLAPRKKAQLPLKEYFAALGARQLERFEQGLIKKHVASLNHLVAERDAQIARHIQDLCERDSQIARHIQDLSERDAQIARHIQDLSERENQIGSLSQAIETRDHLIDSLDRSIREIRESTSWRITAPLRSLVIALRKMRSLCTELPQIVGERGGLGPAICKAVRIFRDEDTAGVKARLRSVLSDARHKASSPPVATSTNSILLPKKLSTVPYYMDQTLDADFSVCSIDASIAVHLHLYYAEMLDVFAAYLNNIPVQYDLYVSVPMSADVNLIQAELQTLLARAGNVVVEPVPNRGRDIAPLIIQFGERLAQYDIIAHVHTKKSPHNSNLADWCQGILTKLMGPPGSSGGRIAHILGLLQTTAKIVYPEGSSTLIRDRSGWADNHALAKHVLEKYLNLSIDDYPVVEFPEGSMFWGRSECLKDFLGLPFDYCDFPAEPIPADGTLAHSLERLLLVFASSYAGQCLCIHEGDSIKDYRQYEEQYDFSSSISHADIKVLAYYLPQFHPIPENDLWHGKGFTEWSKVRTANPLFEGHYQQHIPHPDIGYYLLDSPATLRRQAEQMHKSGVYGQVFYHYWFGGKLILEEPAQLLLDTPDIGMPFCFCWANENWTKKWDGNEDEILLKQEYSAEDAQAFIRYLIPFMQDPRYLKIEDRPMLFVYRPASIPNAQEYLDIWEKECVSAGLERPYLVAVLTRGVTSPTDFGMDAGVERVLHDWTSGSVAEINNDLQQYWPLNGSVLPYAEVAQYYMNQTEAKDFTYFRSTVPIWDNTARYGSEAYLLHGSTPQRFQEWMASSITYTQANLPRDRRFVLVNAWNEWAEGAHLEPDTRYGYSYLNSVGRALSDIPYAAQFNPTCLVPVGTKIHLAFPGIILSQIEQDAELKQKFIGCVSRSSIFKTCRVSINTPLLLDDLPDSVLASPDEAGHADQAEQTEFVLEFRKIAYFDSLAIEKMLQAAKASGATIIPNFYDSDSALLEVSTNGAVHSFAAYPAPLVLVPQAAAKSGHKNFRMRSDARCFVTKPCRTASSSKPMITTIIRFHKSDAFSELKNALFCLYAMHDCQVTPLVVAQDLNRDQMNALKNLFNEFVWPKGCSPQVQYYESQDGNGDLRSKMLNESLRLVKTPYAAFLDFDDLLMPHAYSWLVDRLLKTGKAVAFGRVYSTSYNSTTELLKERKRVYEYGGTYADFICRNHSPLHSFLLDMTQLNLDHISYFDDQRYMEDYLLTLQLFTKENTDWDSLNENHYIGDYIHSLDRSHTLAFSDEHERRSLLFNPEYMVCEQRICDVRKALGKKDRL